MSKRTGNSSVNSSIRQNTAITGDGFTQLLNLQKLSNEQLQSMNTALSVSLLDAMKDIAKNLKQSSPSISSSSIVNNSNSSTSSVIKNKEDKVEGDAIQNKKIALLEKIEHNTGGNIVSGESTSTTGDGALGLGGFATAIAVALGAIVGAFKSQLKAIKFFTSVFVSAFSSITNLVSEALKSIKKLQPIFESVDKFGAAIRKSISSFAAGMSMQFDLVKAAVSEKVSGIGKAFTSAIEAIKSLFTIGEESKIGKFVKSISSGLSTLFAPFIEAFTIVKDFMAGTASKAFTAIKDIFSTIGSKFSSFVGVFKGAAAIFEKLFLPLTIIMTVWDTVKGAIEGFEKDGIIGGISGAIKGFFNSLIFGPADMIKDAIAWVAGMFGFENAKKELESFNFEKMFSSLVDTLFAMPKAIGSWVTDMFAKLKSLEIPKFAYTIPIINKEISIGPFKPFASIASATQPNATSGGSTVQSSAPSSAVPNVQPSSAAPNIAPSPVQSGVAPSQAVSQSSSQVSAMKETQSSNITSNVVSPTVNNSIKQTQIAKIDAPIRSNDSSVDNYFSSRARFI